MDINTLQNHARSQPGLDHVKSVAGHKIIHIVAANHGRPLILLIITF